MHLKLFDFDKTAYLKDSTVELYKFCLKKKPYLILFLPYQIFGFLAYKLRFKSKEYFKEKFLFFIKHFKDTEGLINEFWEKEEKNICSWFKDMVQSDDIVVTASPEFLVQPITDKLGIRCIGSVVDAKTAKFFSRNCKGENKVERLHEIGITSADAAYSDSESDMPMLSLAAKGYIIKNFSYDSMKILKEVNK